VQIFELLNAIYSAMSVSHLWACGNISGLIPIACANKDLGTSLSNKRNLILLPRISGTHNQPRLMMMIIIIIIGRAREREGGSAAE
jgi:hypothetical protein